MEGGAPMSEQPASAEPIPALVMPAGRILTLLHVPRTGGTSLRSRLIRSLGEARVMAKADMQALAGDRDFGTFLRANPSLYEGRVCLVGHMDMKDPMIRLAPARPVFAGVLRDPVERAISLYDFARSVPEHPLFAELQAKTLLEAIWTTPSLVANMADAQMVQLFDTRDYDEVRRRLVFGYYVIGRFDQLETFDQAICQLLDVRDGHLPRINTIESKPHRQRLVPVREQPGFEDAVAWLRKNNQNEQRLHDWLPGLVASPAMLRA